MTCVAFQAMREYIVGKTAPVPVKIYDYYEPGVPLMNILSTALERVTQQENRITHHDL